MPDRGTCSDREHPTPRRCRNFTRLAEIVDRYGLGVHTLLGEAATATTTAVHVRDSGRLRKRGAPPKGG
jgi:hypothetical protein